MTNDVHWHFRGCDDAWTTDVAGFHVEVIPGRWWATPLDVFVLRGGGRVAKLALESRDVAEGRRLGLALVRAMGAAT